MLKYPITPAFKRSLYKSLFAIVGFIIFYLCIFFGTIWLAYGIIEVSYIWLPSMRSIYALLFFGALVISSLSIVYFLIKYLFRNRKVDYSGAIEITTETEPKLMQAIAEIAEKVGTPMPKHTYLVPDVNASVSYDSAFWSLFLPVSKNLRIGLGLMSLLTKDEFRAVIAHEFGHFSQSSTRVGSYVYQVNSIIYHLVVDEDDFEETLMQWANAHPVLLIPFVAAIYVLRAIKYLFQQAYKIVNFAYAKLSREMEFQADSIAVQAIGYKPFTDGLLRSHVTPYSWNMVAGFYAQKKRDGFTGTNLYPDFVDHLKQSLDSEFTQNQLGLPYVSVDAYLKYKRTEINIEDQWASHPDVVERVQAARVFADPETKYLDSTDSALSYLSDSVAWEKKLTSVFLQPMGSSGADQPLPENEFQKVFQESISLLNYAPQYNGFYQSFVPDYQKEHSNQSQFHDQKLEQIFSPEIATIQHNVLVMQNDLQIMKEIEANPSQIPSFDFKGQKYHSSNVSELITKQISQIEEALTTIHETHARATAFFMKKAEEKGATPTYQTYLSAEKCANLDYDNYMQALNQFLPYTAFFERVLEHPDIINHCEKLNQAEKIFKQSIKRLLETNEYEVPFTPELRKTWEEYAYRTFTYFNHVKYIDNEIQVLGEVIQNYNGLVNETYLVAKKRLLDYQLTLSASY